MWYNPFGSISDMLKDALLSVAAFTLGSYLARWESACNGN